MREHAHDEAGISLVIAGQLLEESRCGTVTASAGSVVVKPAGTRHQNRFGPNGAILLAVGVHAPRDRETLAHIRRAFVSWRWTRDLALAKAVWRAIPVMQGDLLGDDVLAELLAVAADHEDRIVRRPPNRAARTAKEVLDDGETRAQSVSDLACIAQVHPVYLARSFRHAFGCSIREYRRHRRIQAAADLVATSARGLSDLAHTVGFSDHPHMCRSMRREIGVSPGELRDLVRLCS